MNIFRNIRRLGRRRPPDSGSAFDQDLDSEPERDPDADMYFNYSILQSYGGYGYDDFDGPIGRSGATRRFDEYYRCYPVAMMPTGRENLNYGGKVIMPPSALDKLTRLHISYPMLFELHNGKGKLTHCGVLEFVAEEGRIYLPQWIMQTLLLEPGDLMQVKSTDLPPGSFIKLQPQSVDFLDISDPKAVLENALRNFSALTKDDIFSFSYNDTIFEIAVLEVKPNVRNGAISVVETDIEVDFAAPVGYVEPERSKPASSVNSTRPSSALAGGVGANAGQGAMAAQIGYQDLAPGSSSSKHLKPSDAFSGSGQKLVNRKSKSKPGTPAPPPPPPTSVAAPPTTSIKLPTNGKIIDTATLMRDGKPPPAPLRLPPGTLFFGYEIVPVKKTEGSESESANATIFSGQGQSLRAASKRKDRDESADPKGKGKATSTGQSSGRTLRGKETTDID
ncbi:ubiquitin fusion degradation protein, variant 2 [Orbilia oligospora]|uniref:Ubiquitin fusion degradation protein 1 n=1 Tax=Orbilia oligospora TaxID=2813651 RepID=A0A6G1MGA2_ORBOL|nr:ubiquitin fusion degradation protein, variant 2 [Orbilia oligospora]KAF3210582.1 ubiquitin fusion degradation protein, variant 2 [Orbilia oligospora]KAF3229152.1 ubiquitin fusion degradation protein, variant 2 [Orbilia oligospora]KAF3255917.1 ubiquitin fusion degradation protein, variant 2 [Orbilia oligospora]